MFASGRFYRLRPSKSDAETSVAPCAVSVYDLAHKGELSRCPIEFFESRIACQSVLPLDDNFFRPDGFLLGESRGKVEKTESDGFRILSLSAAAYGLSAIEKAAHKFEGRLHVVIEQRGPMNKVQLIPCACCKSFDGLARDFCNEVLDQELRERVAHEMAGIRELLLTQAFSKFVLANCA